MHGVRKCPKIVLKLLAPKISKIFTKFSHQVGFFSPRNRLVIFQKPLRSTGLPYCITGLPDIQVFSNCFHKNYVRDIEIGNVIPQILAREIDWQYFQSSNTDRELPDLASQGCQILSQGCQTFSFFDLFSQKNMSNTLKLAEPRILD